MATLILTSFDGIGRSIPTTKARHLRTPGGVDSAKDVSSAEVRTAAALN